MIGQERECPRQCAHIDPLEKRPFPGIGFAANDGDGTDALEGEDIEDHQGDGNQRRINGTAVRAFLGLQCFGEAVHVCGG